LALVTTVTPANWVGSDMGERMEGES
jgi:hypothetical protein